MPKKMIIKNQQHKTMSTIYWTSSRIEPPQGTEIIAVTAFGIFTGKVRWTEIDQETGEHKIDLLLERSRSCIPWQQIKLWSLWQEQKAALTV